MCQAELFLRSPVHDRYLQSSFRNRREDNKIIVTTTSYAMYTTNSKFNLRLSHCRTRLCKESVQQANNELHLEIESATCHGCVTSLQWVASRARPSGHRAFLAPCHRVRYVQPTTTSSIIIVYSTDSPNG